MLLPVRCPSPACGAVFEVPEERLGRNVYCLVCGQRMTARPLPELEERLQRRQSRSAGSAGAEIDRLPLVALVDNVRSLWNVGSIFRTADSCGVSHLALTGITGCPPRPEIAKTALGAEEAVAWSYHADSGEALERLASRGYEPVAIETSPRAVPLFETDWPERICLVIGNEVAGVSKALLGACPLHVAIPMHGVKESLNVAVAFGVAAYQGSQALLQSRSSAGVAGLARERNDAFWSSP